jgi:hypothetical protein
MKAMDDRQYLRFIGGLYTFSNISTVGYYSSWGGLLFVAQLIDAIFRRPVFGLASPARVGYYSNNYS